MAYLGKGVKQQNGLRYPDRTLKIFRFPSSAHRPLFSQPDSHRIPRDVILKCNKTMDNCAAVLTMDHAAQRLDQLRYELRSST